MSVNTVTISLEDYKDLTKTKKKIQKELQDRENRIIERELIVEAKQDKIDIKSSSYNNYEIIKINYKNQIKDLENKMKNSNIISFILGMSCVGLIWILKFIIFN